MAQSSPGSRLELQRNCCLSNVKGQRKGSDKEKGRTSGQRKGSHIELAPDRCAIPLSVQSVLSVPEFLYIFGYETPRQRRNNAAHGWDDEDSHGVVVDAPNAEAALCWADKIAQSVGSAPRADNLHDSAGWARPYRTSGVEQDVATAFS